MREPAGTELCYADLNGGHDLKYVCKRCVERVKRNSLERAQRILITIKDVRRGNRRIILYELVVRSQVYSL